MKKTHYTMEPSVEIKNTPATRRRGSKSESTSDDTEGSLDYSSGNSSSRSTDSSFADILKVLEGPEMTADLAHYLQQQQKLRDDKSVAESSLAYSAFADGESQMVRSHFTGSGSLAYSAVTDGESHMMRSHWTEADGSTLHGADLVTAIPGQHSDYSGNSRQPPPAMDTPLSINDQILFSPAEHADSMKLRKQRKKQRKREQKLRQLQEQHLKTEQPLPPLPPPTPPSARPPKASPVSQEERPAEDDDIWYAKWWVLCFPETFNAMPFKR